MNKKKKYDLYARYEAFLYESSMAQLIEIPTSLMSVSDIQPGGDKDDRDERICAFLNANPDIQEFLLSQNVRRGDIVHLEAGCAYRNEDKFIYDGTQLIPLDFSVDEYGNIPPSFKVIDEFPIEHWFNVIVHNNVVWFDSSPYLDQMFNHLECVKKVMYDPSQTGAITLEDLEEMAEIYRTSFVHVDGATYTVYLYIENEGDSTFPPSMEYLQGLLRVPFWDCYNDEVTGELSDIQIDSETTLYTSIFAHRDGRDD